MDFFKSFKRPTLIDHNNAMRGVQNSELYGFDQITSKTYKGYKLGNEPYLWLDNIVSYKPLPRIETMEAFNICPHVRRILAMSSKFVLAGGAVAGLLRNNEFSDYDIFVISDKEEWDLIDEAVHYIRTVLPDSRFSMSKGLLQLTAQIQIILRPIPSIHSLLHGFDLPHCAFAYDGHRIYCTLLGIYCFDRQCILVNVEYNSTTFYRRIYKYLKRNHSIILYQFAEKKPTKIILGNYLRLNILYYYQISKIIIVEWFDFIRRLDCLQYKMHYSLRGYVPDSSALYHIPIAIPTGFENDPIAPFLLVKLRTFINYTRENFTMRQLLESLNIPPYTGTKEELRFLVFKYIFSIKQGHWKHRYSRSVILKIFDYSTIVCMFEKKITLFDAIDNLYDEYMQSLDKPANFWIVDNPTGQYTMSRTPVEVDASKFYDITHD